MSQHYPPPPGVDGRHNTASRYPMPPTNSNSYRPPPPPPSFGAPPPPPPPPLQHSSSNYDSYASNRYNDRARTRDRGRDDRDRDRDRDRVRERDWNRGDGYGRSDRDRDLRDDRYQPSRRNDSYHPLPPRPQETYRDFRGPDSRGGDSFRPPQADFTFRAEKPSGVGDSLNYQNSYRPADRNAPRGPPRGPAKGSQAGGRGRGGRVGAGGGLRRPWKPFKPSERALLQSNNGGQPTEDFADEENGPIFKALDQLSDSDEADMAISDSDNESGEPTAKRARTAAKPASDDAVPKWSNPDPYTALPPLEDADKKKKDMVQLIRKARVESSGARTSLAAPGDDQDFLRFDSDSDDKDDSEDFIDPLTYNRGPADAPAGPAVTNAIRAPQAASNASSAIHSLPNKPGSDFAPSLGQAASHTGQSAANGVADRQKASIIDLTQSPTKAVVTKRKAPDVDLTRSSDLGTRKRTHDDVLKLPAHAKLKPSPKQPVGGNMVNEWRPTPKEPGCPWVQVPISKAHVNNRFHMEVRDFYEYVKPCLFEERLRGKLVDDLNQVLAKRLVGWHSYSMYPFGSYMSGLYLPTGDMDLAFCSQEYVKGGRQMTPKQYQLQAFVKFIRSNGLAADNRVEPIYKARVPLVKFVDKTTGLKIDISFENISGIVAVNTFSTWKEQWPVMPILVTVIKQFLLMRGLNEPVNGGIGGFSVICMVVSMLQLLPPIQGGAVDQQHDLGSILMHFFDLYGNRFEYETVALRLNPPGYIAKARVREFTYNNPKRLSIIDPNNPANDISGGSKNYPQISACFSQAHQLLRERLQSVASGEKFDSILDVILGGNYSTFREQRDHLRKLHRKVFGYCDE